MINAKALIKDAERILLSKHRSSIEEANAAMLSEALGEASLLAIGKNWAMSEHARAKKRNAFYLSAEFLTGRLVYNNLFCMGVIDEVKKLLAEKGVDIAILEDIEDAALGNGGLGRLAACFLDSAATMDLPLTGYGLRYKYGLFKQEIVSHAQHEIPDDWTKYGDPWSVRMDEHAVVIEMATGNVLAVPYDMPVIGYDTQNVGTLRLWQTESLNEFDFQAFNNYKYKEACANKNEAEDITKVLYPNDWDIEGKRLRFKQQYVLASASVQDILRQYEKKHGQNYRYFARDNAIQLNDTHPVIAIPELIRQFMKRGVAFARAMSYAKQVFAYTNHTVMPEALEKWDLTLVASVSPEIEKIIRRIDKKCVSETGMRIVQNSSVSMADLAVYMGFAVNGVAKLHTELLKKELFKKWHMIAPEKFQNKTNGITQRRWLGLCNPELCSLIEKYVGSGFLTNLDMLKNLEGKISDEMISEFEAVKRIKKQQLSKYVLEKENVELPADFLFDVQIKRLHEYKRQLMNALSLYDIYMEIKEGNLRDFPSVCFVFGAKAAPGYARAKAIIRFIGALSDIINNDPEVNGKMRVCFVSNYNCSYAEKIIPAADFSEQISPAGTEASGTGNMKLMLNGAVTIGTFDGANIEIVEAAGVENEVIFGADIKEIESIRDFYDPNVIYASEKRVKRAVDALISLDIEDENGDLKELHDSLLLGASWHKPDHYYILNDFMRYQEARIGAFTAAAQDKNTFARKCLVNIANAGIFSSDRTIGEYAREIWNISPVKLAKGK